MREGGVVEMLTGYKEQRFETSTVSMGSDCTALCFIPQLILLLIFQN